ncbi:MAG: selenium cofactor biosynthesis protein YqeC [Anaerolineae bacterium]
MRLQDAFDVRKGDMIALVGAGGKTSSLIHLMRELKAADWRVLGTTTTRIGADQLRFFSQPFPLADDLASRWGGSSAAFVYDHVDDSANKVIGLSVEALRAACRQILPDAVLIEADGSRKLPFKLPRSHEPVIPPETTLVVPIVSYEALGKPLIDEAVFNASGMIERFGYPAGDRVQSRWLAEVLRDPLGGLKDAPDSARVMAFVNGVPPHGYARGRARFIAREILKNQRIQAVIIGNTAYEDPAFEVVRRTGAIVLTAGLSSRMGQPKPLLEWLNGETILDHILRELKRACVDTIVVVTGNHAEEVERIAAPHGVWTAHNADYAAGEMLSSVKVGLHALPTSISGALIVLGDQPTLKAQITRRVLKADASTRGTIAAPSYQMRRGHPILISQRYWEELLALPDIGAPRDVINRHADEIVYVNVEDDSVLRDVDTPQQYAEERRRAGL